MVGMVIMVMNNYLCHIDTASGKPVRDITLGCGWMLVWPYDIGLFMLIQDTSYEKMLIQSPNIMKNWQQQACIMPC